MREEEEEEEEGDESCTREERRGRFALAEGHLSLCLSHRKFDIGIYTVISSIDPLRVYTYQEEILLR